VNAAVFTAVAPVLGAVATNKLALIVPIFGFALATPAAGWLADATGEVATESTPAVRAVIATSEIRLRSVVFDICFLSLVKIRNFLTLARRSFGSSNSVSLWHTRVMPQDTEIYFYSVGVGPPSL
jgi:hypothetical protein